MLTIWLFCKGGVDNGGTVAEVCVIALVTAAAGRTKGFCLKSSSSVTVSSSDSPALSCTYDVSDCSDSGDPEVPGTSSSSPFFLAIPFFLVFFAVGSSAKP